MADVDTGLDMSDADAGATSSRSASVSSASDHAVPAGKSLNLPHDRIVGIEHPCIIRDIDKAVKVLGGEQQIKQILKQDGTKATTSLRPDDPFAKKVLSHRSDVDHVLLRIALPRRTGRKRKRGTNEPYQFYDSEGNVLIGGTGNETPQGVSQAEIPVKPSSRYEFDDPCKMLPLKADEVVNRLSAVKDDYHVSPVGVITHTHRFRSLPDFQLISQDRPVMQEMVRSLLNPTLDSIKSFRPDTSIGAAPAPIPGPPNFAPYSQPLHYAYAQIRNTMTVTEPDGTTKSINNSAPRRRIVAAIPYSGVIPTAAPASLPALATCPAPLQQAVRNLGSLLKTRPIITRRAALNLSPDIGESLFKDSTQYASYAFKSGPWKDTHVTFSLDPRLDPACRVYQTLGFQLDNPGNKREGTYIRPSLKRRALLKQAKAEARQEGEEGDGSAEGDHVFDGKRLGESKTYQIVDIVQPQLSKLFEEAEVREECDEQTGWYGNGTVCVARVLMRDMIAVMRREEETEEWEKVYDRVARAVPGTVTEENAGQVVVESDALVMEGFSMEEVKRINELVAAARTLARQGARGKGDGVGKGRRVRSKGGRFESGVGPKGKGADSRVKRKGSMIGSADEEDGTVDDDGEEGNDNPEDTDEEGDGGNASEGDALADLEASEFIE
ncbi:Transcription factor tau subunit sfc1 [Sphaceloma murrayae]|uniref:Transcription factor tau subunit sfc1 n=1 Tax=Sphaceloma murrayae TaxID=2082308 RepID=A0A2K1R1P7_9PEZI|nr:Transcription factor tau subunit sfc1 [Sphaceloma murrayae]